MIVYKKNFKKLDKTQTKSHFFYKPKKNNHES